MKDTFDYKKAKLFLKVRQEKKLKTRKKLFEKATEDFKRIIKMIINDYNPKKIYQWGSLLDSNYFDENSDIDIAVEGLGEVEIFFSLFGRANDMTEFPLDLVELEKISKIHRESIIKNGKLIYERK